MTELILQIIATGAGIFRDERANHYKNKANDLKKKIFEVEDSGFYKKDMEAKGRAERDLLLEAEDLGRQYIKEASELSK